MNNNNNNRNENKNRSKGNQNTPNRSNQNNSKNTNSNKSTERQQQVYAFIDSQNVNLSVQQKGWKLDWTAFRQYLETKLGVTKAFLFIGYMPGNETMYSTLQQQGYILIFKPLVDSADGIKGNVDVEMVLRAMIEYPSYDKAVIVSGDGDFHALIDYLLSNDKLKSLVIPNKERYSSLFKRFESKMTFISTLRRTLEYKHGQRSKSVASKNSKK